LRAVGQLDTSDQDVDWTIVVFSAEK
jgi:hypothetical protein